MFTMILVFGAILPEQHGDGKLQFVPIRSDRHVVTCNDFTSSNFNGLPVKSYFDTFKLS